MPGKTWATNSSRNPSCLQDVVLFQVGIVRRLCFPFCCLCSFPVCSCLNVDRCNEHVLTTSLMYSSTLREGGWVRQLFCLFSLVFDGRSCPRDLRAYSSPVLWRLGARSGAGCYRGLSLGSFRVASQGSFLSLVLGGQRIGRNLGGARPSSRRL